MATIFPAGPKQHGANTTHRIMLQVVLACLPGVTVATWFFGIGFLLNIALASVFAYGFEALVLTLRRRDPAPHLRDNSVLVTAVLFALTVPPGTPWWLLLLGVGFAVVIAKHAFGGLGQNPFNPAMCGYLFLLLAFPLHMTTWHLPNAALVAGADFAPLGWQGLQQSVMASFPFLIADNATLVPRLDGLAMATPLIEFKMAGTSALRAALESGQPIFARDAATGWELMNIGYLLGGLYLLLRGIISWQIPVSILLTVGVIATLFYSPNSYAVYGTPYLHLLGSATMLGAFFIATDPVSAATTARGKLVYGVLIGCSIYSIRVWGSYLDSVAIAVLFGNFCAPLIDHWCRPRIYGRRKTGLFAAPPESQR